jgi:hypothetical protein
MRRVDTTYDLLEAHVITQMLREHGIEAWLFDADFVRQNWFRMIAYGGFRILVREESVADALHLLREYRNGNLALKEDHRSRCPHCAHDTGDDDPQPRRNVFLAMIAAALVWPSLLLAWHPSSKALLAVSAILIGLSVSIPWAVIRYFKWRTRCSDCGYRWREQPRYRYAELAGMAASGESGAP